jgi:hypothetical protein
MENVFSGERLVLHAGYPAIGFNKKKHKCHILSFKTFFPNDWAARKPNEIILHENDDKLDFRPHKLRLGTLSENAKEAHVNACRNGKLTTMEKCASYINGVFEKEYVNQADAVMYLKTLDKKYEKANCGMITKVMDEVCKNGKQKTAYDRVWIGELAVFLQSQKSKK